MTLPWGPVSKLCVCREASTEMVSPEGMLSLLSTPVI